MEVPFSLGVPAEVAGLVVLGVLEVAMAVYAESQPEGLSNVIVQPAVSEGLVEAEVLGL